VGFASCKPADALVSFFRYSCFGSVRQAGYTRELLGARKYSLSHRMCCSTQLTVSILHFPPLCIDLDSLQRNDQNHVRVIFPETEILSKENSNLNPNPNVMS